MQVLYILYLFCCWLSLHCWLISNFLVTVFISHCFLTKTFTYFRCNLIIQYFLSADLYLLCINVLSTNFLVLVFCTRLKINTCAHVEVTLSTESEPFKTYWSIPRWKTEPYFLLCARIEALHKNRAYLLSLYYIGTEEHILP